MEIETFGQSFRRGQETRAEQAVNKIGEEPTQSNPVFPEIPGLSYSEP